MMVFTSIEVSTDLKLTFFAKQQIYLYMYGVNFYTTLFFRFKKYHDLNDANKYNHLNNAFHNN